MKEFRRPVLRAYIAWTIVSISILLIFVSIPFARSFQSAIENSYGRQTFILVVVISLALMFVFLIQHLYARRALKLSRFLWLFMIALAYALWIFRIRANPEVTLHFLEYGALAGFVFYALSFHIQDRLIYPIALCLCSIVGSIDQLIKWLTPRRVFDYYDIWLNAGAAFLVLLAIAKVLRPSRFSAEISSRSVSYLKNLVALQVLLLALFLSNTPSLMQCYIQKLPFLRYVQTKENQMAEYGYKHKDPDIGTFYSRFSTAELLHFDQIRAKEISRTFLEYGSDSSYQAFIEKYSPMSDPFLHEFRVHLFRRDQYLNKVPVSKKNIPECTVALHENIILEKFFPQTLVHVGKQLTPARLEQLKACSEPDTLYESAVSANLITSFSPLQVWLGVLVFLIVLCFL